MLTSHLPTPTQRQVLEPIERQELIQSICLKLATLGLPSPRVADKNVLDLTEGLIRAYQEKSRLLDEYLPPIDQRIQAYLDRVLDKTGIQPRLPSKTIVLDQPGLARELSLPVDGNYFRNDLVQSYRLRQGVLHNPASDRRTTSGVFHVAEEGLPVPPDKKAVPLVAFAKLLHFALNPPGDYRALPFLANQAPDVRAPFVSLLLRPIVCPAVPGRWSEKTMEIRFLVPPAFVCNVDFVESIFGNAGDPSLPENDAALDVEHWTGHTGCVILAPHLTKLTKKEVGLPHVDKATPRQIKDGMCWKSEDELYNDGSAFKVTCRNELGVMVTLIADNYFGYCKKEVKTQISYATNLYGNSEEEHAGGAIAFPRFNLGDRFKIENVESVAGHTLAEVKRLYGDRLHFLPEGHACDREYPTIIYLPENAEFDLQAQVVFWSVDGERREIRISPDVTYIYPHGYKVSLERHPGAPSWRLVGTAAEGTFCHKPCTVSGGGKSEISKSILDFFQFGPFFVSDFQKDMAAVEEILARDFGDRFLHEIPNKRQGPSRPILSPARSLGSVIKLLTPSKSDYTEAYNNWLESIPDHIKAMIFIIKRFYRPEWGDNWRSFFSTDLINGLPGHELKYKRRRLVAKYLRIGLDEDGSWRTYKMRQDFVSSTKIQMEDDITASTVVPTNWLETVKDKRPSIKLTSNCENRLFQRPDEAIHRGADRQTELEMAQPGNFVSNFEPLNPARARHMVEESIQFSKYTDPMRTLLEGAANDPEGSWVVSSAHPRIVDGKPSKNPRYLQVRPDLLAPRTKLLAEMGVRLRRRLTADQPVVWPVNAVLPGRRNNPPDKAAGIRALAVYNPVHYQELPELFMDFICSLTGKSPSTTGAGSEGALTKGPFNALNATADLNGALISYILTGYNGFTTAAGYIGPKYRVDHDISLMIPELWCRMTDEERTAEYLLANECFDKLEDFTHNGRKVLASRLGYRMNAEFLREFFGRLFDSPSRVFNEEMLKPELQDMDVYVDGIDNIVEAQQRVAKGYLEDGSVEAAIPPLKALIHIMAEGSWEGKDAQHPEVRAMFTRDYLLKSDWYLDRLITRQRRDVDLWRRHVKSLEDFLARPSHADEAARLKLADRLAYARKQLQTVSAAGYARSLFGTIGADPLYRG
ncbi:hypothetical protein GC173_00320 [bacterium]|nr:hypothetical protein [bacterium]